MFDERFVRTWRLYLAGSLVAFRVGTMQLFQIRSRDRNASEFPGRELISMRPSSPQPQEPKQERTWTSAMS